MTNWIRYSISSTKCVQIRTWVFVELNSYLSRCSNSFSSDDIALVESSFFHSILKLLETCWGVLLMDMLSLLHVSQKWFVSKRKVFFSHVHCIEFSCWIKQFFSNILFDVALIGWCCVVMEFSKIQWVLSLQLLFFLNCRLMTMFLERKKISCFWYTSLHAFSFLP